MNQVPSAPLPAYRREMSARISAVVAVCAMTFHPAFANPIGRGPLM
jgi:hypothetical protein